MTEPAHPGRTTGLVGLLLALLLAGAYALTSRPGTGPVPPTVAGSAPSPSGPASATPDRAAPSAVPGPVPVPGPGFAVRSVGALRADRSVLVNGHGDADLRYRRAPHNGTRLHFICTGCDAGTWLVEHPRGEPVGGGPLRDPADVTVAVDTVRAAVTTDLLVQARAGASWTVTLTPFDAVPVHEQTFDALGDDVVAVRARTDLQLRCGGAAVVRTLARTSSAGEYAVVQRREEDQPGTWPVTAPAGSTLLVLAVSCPGRWTVTLG